MFVLSNPPVVSNDSGNEKCISQSIDVGNLNNDASSIRLIIVASYNLPLDVSTLPMYIASPIDLSALAM